MGEKPEEKRKSITKNKIKYVRFNGTIGVYETRDTDDHNDRR